jgi:hypothetical protein
MSGHLPCYDENGSAIFILLYACVVKRIIGFLSAWVMNTPLEYFRS